MGFRCNIPIYNILPQKDIDTIDDFSMKILKNIGVKITHERVLNVLYEKGANIDKNIVKFPEELVRNSIKIAEKKHILYGLNKDNKAEFGYGMLNFNGSGEQYQIVDQKSLTRRSPTEDLKLSIKIGDSLILMMMTGKLWRVLGTKKTWCLKFIRN
jgi:trimethylamine:corrinoid methyltransferase-like protein